MNRFESCSATFVGRLGSKTLTLPSFEKDAHKLYKTVHGRLILLRGTYAAATPLGLGTGT
jgi:hypothetical protein